MKIKTGWKSVSGFVMPKEYETKFAIILLPNTRTDDQKCHVIEYLDLGQVTWCLFPHL